MPDNWISTILLTGETDVSIDNVKVHDLIELNEVGGTIVPVDEEKYPVLYDKVSIDSGVFLNMTRNTYSCTIPSRSLSGDWDIEFILSDVSRPSQSYLALCTGDTSDTDKCEVWVNTAGAVIVILDWSAGHQAALGYIELNSAIPQTLRIERRGDNQYSLYIDEVLTGSVDWSGYSGKTWRVRSMGNSSTSHGAAVKFLKYSITNYSVPSNSSVYNLDEEAGNVIVDSVNGLNGNLTAGKYTRVPGFAELPNMTRPTGSSHPYKIIADKYIAPIYRWQDLWTINASNSGWGPEGYADFTEWDNPAMSTIDPEGISNSAGKRVEMDIVVDSAEFTDDYSWLQIYPNTSSSSNLDEHFNFKGDQVTTNNGFSATGTLLDDGRYLFTVNFDNALIDGVLDGNLINIRTHQEMNYFDYSIAEIRVMETEEAPLA